EGPPRVARLMPSPLQISSQSNRRKPAPSARERLVLGGAARLRPAAARAATAARPATAARLAAAARPATPAPTGTSAPAAAGSAAAAATAAGTALVAAVLGQRFHREGAFERAFRTLLLAARGPPRAPALVALVALEALLHRLRHQVDHVLVFADLLRALHFFLGAEDAHQPHPLHLAPRRLERVAQAREPVAGRAGGIPDRLVQRFLHRAVLGLQLRLGLTLFVGIHL